MYSPQLDNTRDIIIFLPASFYENTMKVYRNVLIMHDGQNVFDPETAFMHNAWMAQDTINVLVPDGQMEEVLIIGYVYLNLVTRIVSTILQIVWMN